MRRAAGKARLHFRKLGRRHAQQLIAGLRGAGLALGPGRGAECGVNAAARIAHRSGGARFCPHRQFETVAARLQPSVRTLQHEVQIERLEGFGIELTQAGADLFGLEGDAARGIEQRARLF